MCVFSYSVPGFSGVTKNALTRNCAFGTSSLDYARCINFNSRVCDRASKLKGTCSSPHR